MSFLIVGVVALLVSGLTFFSGFGLGTLLMPAFALFFPIELAVAATAVVHLLNNVFKMSLIAREVSAPLLWRFSLPAALCAIPGAWLLGRLSSGGVLATYSLFGGEHQITVMRVVIGLLLIAFAVQEMHSRLSKVSFDRKYLPLGGGLSGFFGGLSGHQGALRAAFLSKAGLSSEAYVATSIATAVVVDVSRLAVYGSTFFTRHFTNLGSGSDWALVATGTVSAFAGAYIGRQYLKKMTLDVLQKIIGALLIFIGLGMIVGLL
jgi:uncharacterized membrane protein YfcA